MRKAWNILVLCAVLLTGCGNASGPAVSSETTMVSQTQTEPTESAEKEIEPAEEISYEVTETGSDMTSSESQPTITTAEVPQDAVFSTETTMSISESESQTVSSGMNTTETEAPETQMTTMQTAEKTTTVTTTASKPKVTTTTAKQTTAARTTTTTVTTTTTAATTTVTTTTNPDDRYIEVGRNLNHDGTDYGKAQAVYDWMTANGSGTCVNYSCQTYLVCEGIGLDCYCWTDAGIYGHVANVVKVNGIWFVLDTQAGGFLDYNYGFTEVIDINENHVADGNIISDYSYRELYE